MKERKTSDSIAGMAPISRRLFLLCGIVAPLACLILDPAVFRGGGLAHSPEPYLWRFQPFAYAMIFLSVTLAEIYFCFPNLPATCLAFLGGCFAAAGIFSLGLGVRLLPHSLAGLLILIGALGLAPFFTAYAYFYAAVAIYWDVVAKTAYLQTVALIGLVALLLTAGTVHYKFERGYVSAIEAAAEGRDAQLAFYLQVCGDTRLLHAYSDLLFTGTGEEAEKVTSEPNERQRRLAAAYEQATGENFEERVQRLRRTMQ